MPHSEFQCAACGAALPRGLQKCWLCYQPVAPAPPLDEPILATMVVPAAAGRNVKRNIGIIIAVISFTPSLVVAALIGCSAGFNMPVSPTTNFPGYAREGAAMYGALLFGGAVALIYGVVFATLLTSSVIRTFRYPKG